MGRTVYLNGEYVDESAAQISVFDRGFTMADAVYEVTAVLGGKLVDFAGHETRLRRSLRELDMPSPCDTAELLAIHRKLIELNALADGMIYLQVTRGSSGDRSFYYPAAGTLPTVVLYTQAKSLLDNFKPLRVITLDDLRWARRDIKTVQLLGPSMAKMAAKAAGVDDSWMVDASGKVTESTSANAYIVADGKIVTRNLTSDILHGITRAAVVRLAKEAALEVEERAFTVDEAKAADEAFLTSASSFVLPVVEIDGVAIAGSAVGPVTTRMRELYVDAMRASAI